MGALNIQGRSPHQISPHRGSLSLKSNLLTAPARFCLFYQCKWYASRNG